MSNPPYIQGALKALRKLRDIPRQRGVLTRRYAQSALKDAGGRNALFGELVGRPEVLVSGRDGMLVFEGILLKELQSGLLCTHNKINNARTLKRILAGERPEGSAFLIVSVPNAHFGGEIADERRLKGVVTNFRNSGTHAALKNLESFGRKIAPDGYIRTEYGWRGEPVFGVGLYPENSDLPLHYKMFKNFNGALRWHAALHHAVSLYMHMQGTPSETTRQRENLAKTHVDAINKAKVRMCNMDIKRYGDWLANTNTIWAKEYGTLRRARAAIRRIVKGAINKP